MRQQRYQRYKQGLLFPKHDNKALFEDVVGENSSPHTIKTENEESKNLHISYLNDGTENYDNSHDEDTVNADEKHSKSSVNDRASSSDKSIDGSNDSNKSSALMEHLRESFQVLRRITQNHLNFFLNITAKGMAPDSQGVDPVHSITGVQRKKSRSLYGKGLIRHHSRTNSDVPQIHVNLVE